MSAAFRMCGGEFSMEEIENALEEVKRNIN